MKIAKVINVKPMIAKRKELGLKQVDVAKLIPVSTNTVTRWECGYMSPDSSHLAKWLEVLGM